MTLTVSNALTIATACRNREENLRRALESWLNLYPAQIIICDWGSTSPITYERLGVEKHRDKILIFRHEANSWILTWAFNEALCKVKTKFVLKLDCDHVVSHDFLEKNTITPGHFSRGHWRNAEKGQEYINGAFLSCSTLLKNVGYYDERLTTYGWDDSDLYERLYDACSSSSIFAKGTLTHLKQCESTRTKEQDVSKESVLASALGIEKTQFLINRNRVLAGMLWSWNSHMYENRELIRARFSNAEPEEAALIEYATQKAFEIHYQWQDLFKKTSVPAGEAYLQALYTYQQKPSYSPSSLSIASLLRRYADAVHANDELEESLVRMAFLANAHQTRLSSRLEAIEKILNMKTTMKSMTGSESQCVVSDKSNYTLIGNRSKLFIDAQHGLGNRLRAIGSAAAIAESEGYELVIVWEPDEHCNCYFHDLFEYDGLVLDSSASKKINDANMVFYNYMEVEGGTKNAPIKFVNNKSIYIRSAFTLVHDSSNWSAENKFIQTLKPVERVRELVHSVLHPNDVSVHIRMGEKSAAGIPSYEKSDDNWSLSDQALIDNWRSKSNFKMFFDFLDSLVFQNPSLSIFIACDNEQAYAEMLKKYGSRIRYLQRSCFDRSTSQIQYALSDAILLSKSPLLLGSNWSSFTELARRFATKNLQTMLAGVDF